MLSKSTGQILRVAVALHVLFTPGSEELVDELSSAAVVAAIDFVEICCQHTAFIAGRGDISLQMDTLEAGMHMNLQLCAAYYYHNAVASVYTASCFVSILRLLHCMYSDRDCVDMIMSKVFEKSDYHTVAAHHVQCLHSSCFYTGLQERRPCRVVARFPMKGLFYQLFQDTPLM